MAFYKRKKARTTKRKRRLIILTLSVVVALVTVSIAFFSVFMFIAMATHNLPDLKNKQLFDRAQTTKIYDTTGNLITDLYVEQNRVLVPLDKISPYLQKAVISIEDRRFYDHEGVDWKAIMRAFFKDVQQGKIVEGGSTLTQQFIKNTLITDEKTFQRKIREAALAIQIEQKLSKKEILRGYLNTIYFGHSAYGAETASQTFFGKHADELSISEAALLAGVIRSPNNYSPYMNPEIAKGRRDLVISLMRRHKAISTEEASTAVAAPLQLRPVGQGNYPFPYFVDHVKQLVLEDETFGSTVSARANALFKGGLRIYTTIDPKLQQEAEDAVWSTLNRPGDPVGSLVSIEPKTGYIKAMVGGQDWQAQKFNLATQALRQPGSSFKPFVLAAAIEQGISVSKNYESRPAVIKLPGKAWVVNNATEGRGGGQIPLRDATVHSVNAVFARLIMDVGPGKVVEMVKKLGVASPVEALPAIALGGLGRGVTPLDMATAYSTFANNGQHAKPIAITKITKADGKEVKLNPPQLEPAINEVTAYLVTDILKDVIRAGTGRRANIGRPAAGKTGTTEEYGDAWFVGYTPQLSSSVWVGYRENRRPMKGVHGINVQGGTFPAEIWQKFMSKAHTGVAPKDFDRPTKGLVGVRMCADMPGFTANEFCTEIDWATFAKGTGPKRPCDKHKAPPNVKVPNIVGQPVEQAKKSLETIGLNYNIKDVDNPAVPAGQVVTQNPSEGMELPQGSTVDVQISTGRAPFDKVKVPTVTGLPGPQAKAILGDAGLRVSIVYIETSLPAEAGMAISQNPAADSLVNRNSIVVLRVGKG